MIKVIVYPVGLNPYQDLLYNEIKKHKDVTIKYLRNDFIDTKHAFTLGMPLFPLRFLYLRLRGWKIIHLHWLAPFIIPSQHRIFKYLSSLYILSFLAWIKFLGFNLVWTLHEVLPHEQEFHNDIMIRKIITNYSSANIIHTSDSLKQAIDLGYNMDKSYIIPHGNYGASYENYISKSDARQIIGLKNNDFVFMFFGAIKPYKGVDILLKSFERIIQNSSGNDNIKLVIAGDCKDKNLQSMLMTYGEKYKRNIKIFLHYIENNNVQTFLNAADIVVLPFKENTTSGSAILALSFGRPVIAPLLGSITDLPANTGYYYYPNDNPTLYKQLLKIFTLKDSLPEIGLNALNYSKKLSWRAIGKETYNVYKNLY